MALRKMPWDERIWLTLRRAAAYIPPSVRMEAILTTIEESEREAKARGSAIVEENDLVKAVKKKVPPSVRDQCLAVLQELGINVSQPMDFTVNMRFVSKDTIEVTINDKTHRFEVKELPEEFVDWQLSSRIETLERMAKGERVTTFLPHLPVVATKSDGAFLTTANKGIGFVPKDEYLDHYTTLFEEARKLSPKEATKKSAEYMLELLKSPEKLDLRKFGSLELFGKKTWENIKRDPRVTLHFLDLVKGYLKSYSVNCIAQIFGEETAMYRYENAVHKVFLPLAVHLPIKPLCAYAFWVCEVYWKAPGPKAGVRIV